MNKLTINGETIAYEEIGSGTPIIFLHPPGMGRKVFYEQKPLSENFRIILPDLVGAGDSTYNGSSPVTIRRISEDMIALMDQLNIEKAVIFGYSSGGTIAQDLGIHFSDRIHALCLSGCFPIVDTFALRNQHRVGIYVAKRNKELLSKSLAIGHTKDKEYRRILTEHMLKSNSEVWAKLYAESLYFNCKAEIKGLELPVLLMYGSRADRINTYIKFYKKNLTNKKINVIKGISHQLPTKKPNQVNHMVKNFLLNL